METTPSSSSELEEGKIWALIAYLLWIVGFVIVLLAKKDNRFALFHAKQSLVLSIAGFAIGAATTAIWAVDIPFIGWLILLGLRLLSLGVFVLWILGIVNALSGKEEPLPLIGAFADQIKV